MKGGVASMDQKAEFEKRRTSFDLAARDYDRFRPGYAAGAFEFLKRQTGAGSPEVLEIGCGSGQATQTLVKMGYNVHAIDISPKLIGILSRKIPDGPRFKSEVRSFEELKPTRKYDLV